MTGRELYTDYMAPAYKCERRSVITKRSQECAGADCKYWRWADPEEPEESRRGYCKLKRKSPSVASRGA